MAGKSCLGKGGSNKVVDYGTKGHKAPSVKAVGTRADKFHTSGGK
jgi:hypothetical protein